MEFHHSLLARQLKRCFGTPHPELAAGAWSEFVAAVNAAYRGFDSDREMLERSLELSSQELLQANAEMRAVLQSIPDLILRLDAGGRILDARAGAGDPVAARPRGETGHGSDPAEHVTAEFRAAVAQVVATRAPAALEYTLERERETVHYEARFAPVLENQAVAFVREITTRRRAEVLRAAQNGVLELIVSGAPLHETLSSLVRLTESQVKGMMGGVLLVDPTEPRLRACAAPNLPPAFVQALDGIPIGEGNGTCGTAAARKWLVIADDIRKGEFGAEFGAFAEKFGVRACWSAPIMSSHDTVLGTLAMYFREPRSPGPAERELLTIAAHIAGIAIQRRQAEQDLQHSVALLQSTFDSTADGLLVVDQAGRMVSCNKRFVALWRIPPDVLEQMTNDATLTHMLGEIKQPEAFLRRVQELYSDPAAESFELVEFKDGRVFERYSCPHCVDGVAVGRVWSFRDISQRRQLEQQFLQSQKMEAVGQLAGGVAHDFNNMLTVIIGNLSLMRLGDLPAAQAKVALEDCLGAAQRAANLTSQLLTFSRRQPIEPRTLDLNDVVANHTKMLQRLIGEHIALKVGYASGGALVRADPGMMEQALMNLALNSRDAMPGGGVLRIATAVVEFDAAAIAARHHGRPGRFVRMSVSDTGSGIAREHLPHIFEPFYTTKEVGKGTGLGLATVFGIVEQHAGWIEVDSELGAGTAMHAYLPAAPVGAMLPAPPTETQPRRGTETVLVAEDEAAVRHLMCKLLKSGGYVVHAASNGAAALELWRRYRGTIHLLITDMVMPGGIGGRELASQILADQPGLPVIYCSGYTDEMLGADLPLRRAPNFLEKPFDAAGFLDRVRGCLDGA